MVSEVPCEASWLWSRTHPRWPRRLLACPRPELQGARRRVAQLRLLLKLSLVRCLRESCLGSSLPFLCPGCAACRGPVPQPGPQGPGPSAGRAERSKPWTHTGKSPGPELKSVVVQSQDLRLAGKTLEVIRYHGERNP